MPELGLPLQVSGRELLEPLERTYRYSHEEQKQGCADGGFGKTAHLRHLHSGIYIIYTCSQIIVSFVFVVVIVAKASCASQHIKRIWNYSHWEERQGRVDSRFGEKTSRRHLLHTDIYTHSQIIVSCLFVFVAVVVFTAYFFAMRLPTVKARACFTQRLDPEQVVKHHGDIAIPSVPTLGFTIS